jgi:uncharacterized protein YndB with AHSA1/START domain
MNLLFDFTVDKEAKVIRVTREFAAGLDLVWDAFTKPEILDLWSAPKPWRVETKDMDFRQGGRWLYAMVSPENMRHWSLVEFTTIQPKTHFSSRNSFSDEHGTPPVNDAFSLTTNTFKEGPEVTTVYIEKKFNDLAMVEMMVSRGFKEGTAASMANLDDYLQTLTTR